MLSIELIKRLKADSDFQEFIKEIESNIDELDSVLSFEGMSNESAGEEAKIRFKTIKVLYNILSPFLDFNEKKLPTADQIKKAKIKFAL